MTMKQLKFVALGAALWPLLGLAASANDQLMHLPPNADMEQFGDKLCLGMVHDNVTGGNIVEGLENEFLTKMGISRETPDYQDKIIDFWNANSGYFICQGKLNSKTRVTEHIMKQAIAISSYDQLFYKFLLKKKKTDVNAVEWVNGEPESILDFIDKIFQDPDASDKYVLRDLQRLRKVLEKVFHAKTAAQLLADGVLIDRASYYANNPAARAKALDNLTIAIGQTKRIPAGSFTIGSNDDQPLRFMVLEPYPKRQVTLDYAMEVGVFQVTNRQLGICDADGSCRGEQAYREDRPDHAVKSNRKKPNAAMFEFIDFLNRQSALLGQPTGWRLPTNMEWEYFARAGTETDYPWGDQRMAGFDGCPSCDKDFGPVGRFPANRWGLYDIMVNEQEAVEGCRPANDVYGAINHSHIPTDGSFKHLVNFDVNAYVGNLLKELDASPSRRLTKPAFFEGSKDDYLDALKAGTQPICAPQGIYFRGGSYMLMHEPERSKVWYVNARDYDGGFRLVRTIE